MLDGEGEGEGITKTAQIEVGVAPGVELGRAASAWPSRNRWAPFLA